MEDLKKTYEPCKENDEAVAILRGKDAPKEDKVFLEQLKKGTKHEMEHTTDIPTAEKIARDHLKEDPLYYDHLEAMEAKHKKGEKMDSQDNDILKMYAPIQKIDVEQRMVYGYATTSTEDRQGDIIDLQASFDAVDEWSKWATIKEMHKQDSAVGVAPVIEKHPGVGVYIGAKIVDDQAWRKVQEKVYKGFSIGGKTIEKKGKHITKYQLREISLVDKPANPDTLFAICKRDDTDDADASTKEADKGGKTMPEEIKPEVAVSPSVEAAPAMAKAEATVSKPEAETMTISKADYEKQTARLADLEKAVAVKAKEDEARDTLIKMIGDLKPVIRKEYEEVKPEVQTAEQKEAIMKADLGKKSLGELTAQMFKDMKDKS